jgi:hypothetical protein
MDGATWDRRDEREIERKGQREEREANLFLPPADRPAGLHRPLDQAARARARTPCRCSATSSPPSLGALPATTASASSCRHRWQRAPHRCCLLPRCLLPPDLGHAPLLLRSAAASTAAAASTSTSCASHDQYGEREKRRGATAHPCPARHRPVLALAAGPFCSGRRHRRGSRSQEAADWEEARRRLIGVERGGGAWERRGSISI